MMRPRPSALTSLLRILGLALLPVVASGCASLVETGVRSLVGEGAPVGMAPAPDRGRAVRSAVPPDSGRPAAVTSVYQHAPTHDWVRAPGAPFPPARSLFDRVAPTRVSCQAVPSGLAQVFSGPTGPTASPLASLGPVRLALAGPDGPVSDAFVTRPDLLAARALNSGARMAGHGPACGSRFYLFMSIGGQPEEVSVLR